MANGDDSLIFEEGNEKDTDTFSDIQLIDKSVYDNFDDSEKPNWVR